MGKSTVVQASRKASWPLHVAMNRHGKGVAEIFSFGLCYFAGTAWMGHFCRAYTSYVLKLFYINKIIKFLPYIKRACKKKTLPGFIKNINYFIPIFNKKFIKSHNYKNNECKRSDVDKRCIFCRLLSPKQTFAHDIICHEQKCGKIYIYHLYKHVIFFIGTWCWGDMVDLHAHQKTFLFGIRIRSMRFRTVSKLF